MHFPLNDPVDWVHNELVNGLSLDYLSCRPEDVRGSVRVVVAYLYYMVLGEIRETEFAFMAHIEEGLLFYIMSAMLHQGWIHQSRELLRGIGRQRHVDILMTLQLEVNHLLGSACVQQTRYLHPRGKSLYR